jgi:hypothetical protein
MYGLPPNIDLSFLKGQTLVQVCFGEHSVVLNFSAGTSGLPVSISVQSAVELSLPEGGQHRWEDFRQGAGFLMALISNTVAAATGTTDGTVTLEFNEGGVLRLYDNSKHYESYSIRHGEKIIVV